MNSIPPAKLSIHVEVLSKSKNNFLLIGGDETGDFNAFLNTPLLDVKDVKIKITCGIHKLNGGSDSAGWASYQKFFDFLKEHFIYDEKKVFFSFKNILVIDEEAENINDWAFHSREKVMRIYDPESDYDDWDIKLIIRKYDLLEESDEKSIQNFILEVFHLYITKAKVSCFFFESNELLRFKENSKCLLFILGILETTLSANLISFRFSLSTPSVQGVEINEVYQRTSEGLKQTTGLRYFALSYPGNEASTPEPKPMISLLRNLLNSDGKSQVKRLALSLLGSQVNKANLDSLGKTLASFTPWLNSLGLAYNNIKQISSSNLRDVLNDISLNSGALLELNIAFLVYGTDNLIIKALGEIIEANPLIIDFSFYTWKIKYSEQYLDQLFFSKLLRLKYLKTYHVDARGFTTVSSSILRSRVNGRECLFLKALSSKLKLSKIFKRKKILEDLQLFLF